MCWHLCTKNHAALTGNICVICAQGFRGKFCKLIIFAGTSMQVTNNCDKVKVVMLVHILVWNLQALSFILSWEEAAKSWVGDNKSSWIFLVCLQLSSGIVLVFRRFSKEPLDSWEGMSLIKRSVSQLKCTFPGKICKQTWALNCGQRKVFVAKPRHWEPWKESILSCNSMPFLLQVRLFVCYRVARCVCHACAVCTLWIPVHCEGEFMINVTSAKCL